MELNCNTGLPNGSRNATNVVVLTHESDERGEGCLGSSGEVGLRPGRRPKRKELGEGEVVETVRRRRGAASTPVPCGGAEAEKRQRQSVVSSLFQQD
ncbi:hypothetical protein CRG98_040686 [Punica granatum]|uniref:Uncharacterized protein n=1 Tax=Punica granatum TaxID=22663 RepID=A0A2I0I4K3_PUNGR|nr:hypothetical protein CRG98_040686 [Punica granatum]